MGLVFLIVVGAILGWLAAFILRAESPQSLKVNVIAGIGGALLAGLLVGPALSMGDLAAGTYTVDALLFSMAGSLATLLVANILRQKEVL
ncbi:GlsB/YeaQ/YmgE family stress response membrane protein [Aurantiacibacter hainanensis]|uniref:GlsB/YeaQ/YmgE family stress response membrane protein n=1 Tax=Aurantiacibacter hainanensis TaxID=3076114 RepID=UPI0030C6F2E5